MAPSSGAPGASQASRPSTVPVILPHVGGGVTFIVTGTGGTVCGVSSLMRSSALYAPGWSTSATEASNVTVTSTLPPASTIPETGSSRQPWDIDGAEGAALAGGGAVEGPTVAEEAGVDPAHRPDLAAENGVGAEAGVVGGHRLRQGVDRFPGAGRPAGDVEPLDRRRRVEGAAAVVVTTGGVEGGVGRRQRQVGPGALERRPGLPGVCRDVVPLGDVGVARRCGIAPAPDHVDELTGLGVARGADRGRHRGAAAPRVRGDVVDVHLVGGASEEEVGVTADEVDLAVEGAGGRTPHRRGTGAPVLHVSVATS